MTAQLTGEMRMVNKPRLMRWWGLRMLVIPPIVLLKGMLSEEGAFAEIAPASHGVSRG